MILRELLEGVEVVGALPEGLGAMDVSGLEYDSRKVRSGYLFFAFPGARADGRKFAEEAMSRGALVVVSELPAVEGFEGPWIRVAHGRRAMARAARNFYSRPDERVHFTGITGTNGKTTTALLIDAILRVAGQITGLIGTIEYRMAGEVRPAANTTPESLDLMRFAAALSELGGKHLTAEISSHALALGRVWGFQFHTVVFTNLTRDHLDFHGTMEEYGAAKRLLFSPEQGPHPLWAVLNADDPEARRMTPGLDTRVIWYGLGAEAALRAENIQSSFAGLRFDVIWLRQRQPVESPLVGRFNVLNILAAVGTGLSYGLDLEAIARGIAACTTVPGRFERIDCGQPFLVVVDYAHTDDALRNALLVARELTSTVAPKGPMLVRPPNSGAPDGPTPVRQASTAHDGPRRKAGRVIVLFGCGGDRDRSKRPLMGMAAAELSDFVVLTSDNPRSEDPLAIMNDALVGIRRFDTPMVAEPDRAKAIRLAIAEAQSGDVLLLAGKGHETYQVLRNETIHFDDRETAREVLRSYGHKEKGGGSKVE